MTKRNTRFQKGEAIRKGTTHSDASKSKMSEARSAWWTMERREQQKERMAGKSWSPSTQFKTGEVSLEKHPLWKGGITLMKSKAKERDNFTCQVCGIRDEEIVQADHIVPVCVNESMKYE